jgi:hypothetical protein
MANTPLSSMIELTESAKRMVPPWDAQYSSMAMVPPWYEQFASLDDVTKEAASLLRPFLVNPERHAPHVKLLLAWAGLNYTAVATQPFFRALFRVPLVGKAMKRAMARFAESFEETKRRFIAEIEESQKDLLRTLVPVELAADVFPINRCRREQVCSRLPANSVLFQRDCLPDEF